MNWLLLAALLTIASVGFTAGRHKAGQFGTDPETHPHSRPNFHGYYVLMWTLLPAAVVGCVYLICNNWIAAELVSSELPAPFKVFPEADLAAYLRAVERAASLPGYASGEHVFDTVLVRFREISGQVNLVTLLALFGAAYAGLRVSVRQVAPDLRARVVVERGIEIFLFLCAGLAVATTVGIVLSLLFESLRFFAQVPLWDFLTGLHWNAQTSAEFGAVPLFFGTFMISAIAMVVAAPVGLFSAIYLSEYAGARSRNMIKPILEILAGVPTVVYGFFALLLVAPGIRSLALWINRVIIEAGWSDGPVLAAQPTSALAAGIVMGVMVIPFVSSLSDDVISAVPHSLRDGALAMGATKSEMIRHVVIPAALPGIIAALLLAVSRAIGETMIVVMAAGQRAQVSMDPTSDLTTITVQIVSLLTGESEFDSPKTLSAFALGLVLFVITLLFNLVALSVVKRFREKYD